MNVHWLVVGSLDLDFIPRYVVPTIVVLMVLIIVGSFVKEHFEIIRLQKTQNSQVEMKHAESAQLEPVGNDEAGSDDWVYPCLFKCHAHDSSRLRIDTEIMHALTVDDLNRLTTSERWFVIWYHAERKKGITHWSTLSGLSMPDASQDDVCEELKMLIVASQVVEREIV